MTNKLAFIGGSGLYEIEDFDSIEKINIETPWGYPSEDIVKIYFNNKELYFYLDMVKVTRYLLLILTIEQIYVLLKCWGNRYNFYFCCRIAKRKSTSQNICYRRSIY